MLYPLAQFDPEKLAGYEKENYKAYYQRNWLKLISASIQMIREAYHLSWLEAVFAAYEIARAEIAFAPKNNDLQLVKKHIRRFYSMLNKIHKLDLVLDAVVEVEINWWIVHRNQFGIEQNQSLAAAIAVLLQTVYRIDGQNAHLAGTYRAMGMLRSDQWVQQGMDPTSTLLDEEEELLSEGYKVIKKALQQEKIPDES
jgi:hypothetical protein